MKKTLIPMLCMIAIAGHAVAQWNNPHASSTKQNTLYSAFSSSPKTLDPARAYSSDETGLIAQIYETPLQYHYLKRPYTLIPLTLAQMPQITHEKKNGKIIDTIYDLKIKHNIYYQPHPAFVKNQIPTRLHD